MHRGGARGVLLLRGGSRGRSLVRLNTINNSKSSFQFDANQLLTRSGIIINLSSAEIIRTSPSHQQARGLMRQSQDLGRMSRFHG